MRNLLVLVAAAAACTADAAPAGKAKASRVEAKNECILSSDTLLAHALFPIHYSGERPHDSRQLYQFKCDLATRDCRGASIDLDHVDAGRQLDVMDLNVLIGARISSVTGSVITVQWGPLRTFTFDLAQKTAKYVESGEGMLAGHTEGRGEVAIGVTDARRCQADSGCLPGFRCSERICVAK
jgi:hypothetical protein